MVRTTPDVVSFAIGEPDFGTPKHIQESAKAAIEQGYTRYTPNAGFDDLREAIKEKLQRENDLDAETNEIVVTPGGQGALTLVMMDDRPWRRSIGSGPRLCQLQGSGDNVRWAADFCARPRKRWLQDAP